MATSSVQSSQQPPPVALTELDNIAKFKALVPIMKKSLSELMQLAAEIFHQNSEVDTCVRGNETPLKRFDKCLEEFYAQCDQIEIALRCALESHGQAFEAQKNTPQQVTLTHTQKSPDDPAQGTISYSQYLLTVRTQVNCAREIHDILMESSTKLNERSVNLGMQIPNQTSQ